MTLSGEYLVGIDSGTQSVRVIIFDTNGNVVSQGSANHEPPFSLRTGWAEHHPADLWLKLCHASRQAIASFPGSPGSLSGVGLAAQKAILVSVDKSGKPLRPAFSWMDQRKVSMPDQLPGLSPEQVAARESSKANWMQVHEPDLFRHTDKFLTASGWLLHSLTGELKDSSGMQVNESPFDMKKMNWHVVEQAYQVYGMAREKLVELAAPGTLIGRITPTAAVETGLPAGLPVVSGASDKVCECLGAGAVFKGQVSISYGTLACATVTTSKFIKSAHGFYWTNPGAIPGTWNLEYDLPSGYWMVRWFCDQFGEEDQQRADLLGVPIEHYLDQQAADLPAGSAGLLLAPFWTAPTLAPSSRGVVLGFQPHHTRAHVYKAIIEGIIFGLRDGLEALVKDTRTPATEIIAGGGGAQSSLTLQATADIMGLPVKQPHIVEIGALGAAIDAAVGAGIYPDFETAVSKMTRHSNLYEPAHNNHQRYETIYREIYKPLYPALRDIYHRLDKIDFS